MAASKTKKTAPKITAKPAAQEAPEPVEQVQEEEPVTLHPRVIVKKVYQKCPYCKSVRSSLTKTEPSRSREYRRCKSCRRVYVVVDKLPK